MAAFKLRNALRKVSAWAYIALERLAVTAPHDRLGVDDGLFVHDVIEKCPLHILVPPPCVVGFQFLGVYQEHDDSSSFWENDVTLNV